MIILQKFVTSLQTDKIWAKITILMYIFIPQNRNLVSQVFLNILFWPGLSPLDRGYLNI